MSEQTPPLTVMVVENDPVFRAIVTDILVQEGYEVLMAEDGLAALDLLEKHTPLFFLIDLIMPGIGGEKLCRIIRANPRFDRSLLVILSATASENELEAAAAGADVSMAKAPRPELASRLRKLFTDFRSGSFGFPPMGDENERMPERGITRELLALRRHLVMVLDNVDDGIFELAWQTGKILYANRQAAFFFGQPEEKLLGREVAELFPEGLRDEVRQVVAAALPERMAPSAKKTVPFKGRLLGLSALQGEDSLLFFLRDETAPAQREHAARTAHIELDQIFNSLPDGLLVIDREGHIIRMNNAYRELFGVAGDEEHLVRCSDSSPGPRCRSEQCSLRRILAGEERVEIEEEKRRSDGRMVPIHLVATPLHDAEGNLFGIVENCRDITERRHREQELRESSARFRTLFDNTLVGILFATRDRVIADLNERAASVLGYQREELIGQSLAMIHLTPEHFARFGEEVLAKGGEGGMVQLEYQLRRKDGTPLWAQLSGKRVILAELGGEGMLWVADDISRRKKAEEDQRQIVEELRETQDALRNLSIRDPLTDLFNRRYMEESLQREISKARRQNTPLALFMLDLDHFKAINDTHGHVTGDWVLRKLGEILRHNIREEDIACRYGGEEFVVIFPNIQRDDAKRRGEHLRANVERYLKIESMGQSVGQVTISIGIAMHEAGMDRETLLRKADNALYRAKSEGRNRVVL